MCILAGTEEVLMGRRIWVGCGFFSSGGVGGEEETPGQVLLSRFRRTTRGFTTSSSDHREGVPDPRDPGQTRVLFKFRQPDDLFHTLKTVKGILHLVPSRTPRSSGYGVLYTCDLCYITCYFCCMLSLGSSSSGSTRIHRSVHEIHRSVHKRCTPNIYRCIPT
jgi:hypothetical protein